MQKKRITISIILIILITLMVYLLTQTKTMQNNQQKTAQALYTTIGTKTYEIDYAVTTEPNAPALSAGMIPVKYDEEKEEWIITENDENWYDYTSSKPAYIMLNDGVYQSELLPDMTGKKLAKDYVGNDALVVPLDGTIYMWVPRYAYNEGGEIIYIKQEYTVAGSWKVPDIFTYKIENEIMPDFSLSGIWVEYNALENESAVTTKVSNMTGENNTYGFIANTIATNAKNESDVVGNDALVVPWKNILNLNTNRTILKVINTNKAEPIKAKAYKCEINEEEKLKIEVTYSKNPIAKILDIEGNILSENSNIAYVDPKDLPKLKLIRQNEVYKNQIIIVDSEENISQVDIKASDVINYTIPDLPTLKLFRDEVNSGVTYENKIVEVVANIDINPDKHWIDETSKQITFANNAETWIPIGSTTKKFKGVFKGNNNTISGIYINSEESYKGLFGYVENAEIQGIQIDNTKIIGTSYISALASYSINSNFKNIIINENVMLEGTGKENGYDSAVGGVAGSSRYSTFLNCTNYGKLKAKYNLCGGITSAGRNPDIQNCENYGEINGYQSVGGIIGWTSEAVNVINCKNRGNVNAASNNNIGGIVGCMSNSTTNANIKNNINYGDLVGSAHVGGMVGYVACTGNLDIDKCGNEGSITANWAAGGGIIGLISGEANLNCNIQCCYNNAHVLGAISTSGNASSLAGGILGFSASGATTKIENCYNSGIIEGTKQQIGGIVGAMFNGTINYCYSRGSFIGTTSIGSICGYANATKFSKCYWTTSQAITGASSGTSPSNCSKVSPEENLKTYVNTLNSGQTENVWVNDTTNINNGYPILKWQSP